MEASRIFINPTVDKRLLFNKKVIILPKKSNNITKKSNNITKQI
jgi:hypothetical protein